MVECTINEKSSLANKSGNIIIYGGEEIKETAQILASNGVDLYSAELIIKRGVFEKYGDLYYSRNGEAIHAIIEEVYNSIERSKILC